MSQPEKKTSEQIARDIAIKIHSPEDQWSLPEFFQQAVSDSIPIIKEALDQLGGEKDADIERLKSMVMKPQVDFHYCEDGKLMPYHSLLCSRSPKCCKNFHAPTLIAEQAAELARLKDVGTMAQTLFEVESENAALENKVKELTEVVDRLEAALRLVAHPELQDKYTSQQIAKHALREEPLQP